MIHIFSYKCILVLVFCFFVQFTRAQESRFYNKLDSSHRQSSAKNIFDEIELGISSGKPASILGYLSSQTYLSLSNGTSGYYSSNQAYYILEDYFRIYRVISFRLQNVKVDEYSPYATGTYHYDFRGKRGVAKVFISLNKTANSWKISQLTID